MKKHEKKRLLALVLAVLMVFAIIPANTLANGSHGSGEAVPFAWRAIMRFLTEHMAKHGGLEPMPDFELTISVEETTMPQGEGFNVDVELKNNSGEEHEIYYGILFWPFIPGWAAMSGVQIDPPEFQPRSIEANGVLRNIGVWGAEGRQWLIGDDLAPGTHELRFRAAFYLNFEQDDRQLIEVWSNTVLLTVR